MQNLDNVKNMETLRAELFNAMTTEDADAQKEAFTNWAEGLQEYFVAEAKNEASALNEAMNDEKILINRGTLKALTSEEKKYFNAVVERKGFDNVQEAFPKTIIEDVFKYLKQEHPLLSKIDMKDTTGLATYIFAKPETATAFWGPICEDIKQMILSGFTAIDLKSSRLSGFVAVCKGMLELGPNWLANYVISAMTEIMSTALELAVVQGNGKNQPIGMIKKLSGATDSVYPDKEKVALAKLDATALAGIRATLAKAKLDSTGVAVLVNPVSYWSKVFPSLAFRADDGQFVLDKLATGETIITSYAVPEDVLVVGNPQNYFLGVSGDVRIDRYKETLAIEDMELFITKFYGYGLAKDKNAFFVCDISKITGAPLATLEVDAENTGNNQDSTITKKTKAE